MSSNFYITISNCARFKLEKKNGGCVFQSSKELCNMLRVHKLHSGDNWQDLGHVASLLSCSSVDSWAKSMWQPDPCTEPWGGRKSRKGSKVGVWTRLRLGQRQKTWAHDQGIEVTKDRKRRYNKQRLRRSPSGLHSDTWLPFWYLPQPVPQSPLTGPCCSQYGQSWLPFPRCKMW